MAVSFYVGPPGSGKTYEAVFSVMLPAFKAGRTIITNIKGVKPDYWRENVQLAEGETAGEIRVVDDAFFQDEGSYPLMDGTAGDIPAGALVVVDEAYNIYPTGADAGVTKRMIEYVRTHRHFVDATGIASDLVLITQDVMSIHPRVRSVAEFVVSVRNMRHLGMRGRYRVNVFNHWKMTASSALGESHRKYKAHIFKLYKSFEAEGAARVVMTDKSHKALKWYHVCFLLCACGALVFGLLKFGKAKDALTASHDPVPVMANGSKIPKPECSGSGVLVDLDDRRVFSGGEWRPVNAMFMGEDGRARWDVGPCVIAFGSGAARGRDTASYSGGGGG